MHSDFVSAHKQTLMHILSFLFLKSRLRSAGQYNTPVLTFSSLSPQPFVICTQWGPCFWSLETRLPGSSPRSGQCPSLCSQRSQRQTPSPELLRDQTRTPKHSVPSTFNQKVLYTYSLFTSSVTCDLHSVCQPIWVQTPWERLLVMQDIQVFVS